MTEAQKLHHFTLALNLCGLSISKEQAELVYKTTAMVNDLGGEFTIRDFTILKAEVHEKYARKAKKTR
jgi:hypothetical protein